MLTTQFESAAGLALLERISDARRRSDELFASIRVEALYDRPIAERHRIIFYVGHLEAFDWNLLHQSVFDLKSRAPELDRLFAFGIDPVGGGLPSDQPSDWPSLEVVRDYVRELRAGLDGEISKQLLEGESQPRGSSSLDTLNGLDTLLNVAIEHRLMHVETLSYMFHQLPFDKKVRPENVYVGKASTGVPVVPRMIDVAAGAATLGLARNSEIFGWDNEYEKQTIHVPAFTIDRYKVTNGEYLKFVAAGGYNTQSLWDVEGWDWKTSHAIAHPVFWRKSAEDRWLYRTMFDELPLPLDWPVYVSQAEASAYARWAGKSLPTEAEWHRAAYGSVNGTERTYPWGDEIPSGSSRAALGNFDFYGWNPTPVNAFPDGQSAFGVDDMLGNGWEWTSSVFAPFPGFEAFAFYPGYSANFFDGKHFVLKGGSARTAACMLRPTFRNWFQAHYQYVYAGFRCVNR
jgi:gamma-glutamyl hercynylcysteine S-oxide synthase